MPQCSLGPLPPRRRVLDGPSRRHFYLRNLCLNLNLALPALLLAPLLLLAGRLVPAAAGEPPPRPGRAAVLLSGGYLWLAFYSAIPHKEERFLFPAYPLFLLAAALAASEARRVAAALLARCAPRRAQRGREGGPHGVWPPLWGLPAAALAASALLSAGRVGALVSYYGAPLEVYSQVSAALSSRADDSPLRVCSGKEWYRCGSPPRRRAVPPPRGAASTPRLASAAQVPLVLLPPAWRHARLLPRGLRRAAAVAILSPTPRRITRHPRSFQRRQPRRARRLHQRGPLRRDRRS